MQRGGQSSNVSTSRIALYLLPLLLLLLLLLVHFYLRKLRHVGNCSSFGGGRGSRSVARHLQNSIVRNCVSHTHTHATSKTLTLTHACSAILNAEKNKKTFNRRTYRALLYLRFDKQ